MSDANGKPSLLPVLPFDPDLLPAALRPWCLDIAERMQCPLDFVAVSAMVTLAAVVGRRVGIRPKQRDDWLVIANLWGPLIGRPGMMKSPPMKEATRPLTRLEIRAKEEFERAAHGSRVATAMNNWIGRTRDRSNLFYLQSDDLGKTWQTAAGEDFVPPIRQVQCPPLVRDFWAEHLQVYVQHLTFDGQGRPAILFLTSPAGQTAEGPGGPRTWTIAHWTGERWAFHQVTTSANNFDCGSLYIEEDGTWRIIGSTEPGPQAWKTGGEIAMWTSGDQGESWKKVKQLTEGSKYNHCYVRRPVDAHPDFYGLWADGDGDKPSPSQLYFCSKAGEVRVLPQGMSGQFAQPQSLEKKVTLVDPCESLVK